MSAESLENIVPEITRSSDEKITDIFIDSLLKGEDLNVDELLQKLQESGERYPVHEKHLERISRVVDQVHDFLEEVDTRFPDVSFEDDDTEHTSANQNRMRIRSALSLMLKVHINQGERADTGKPFISHPLTVAQRVLVTYTGDDLAHVCIAALLHDVVEDQARLLKLEKEMIADFETHFSKEKDAHLRALDALGSLFGQRVEVMVNRLSGPSGDNADYTAYVKDILSPDGDAGAFAIKWADLQENALTIDKIHANAYKAEIDGDKELSEKLFGFYKKLAEKYKPALTVAREVFARLIEDNLEEHPYYEFAEQNIKEIDDAIRFKYTLPVPGRISDTGDWSSA